MIRNITLAAIILTCLGSLSVQAKEKEGSHGGWVVGNVEMVRDKKDCQKRCEKKFGTKVLEYSKNTRSHSTYCECKKPASAS